MPATIDLIPPSTMKGYGQNQYLQKMISLVDKNDPCTTNVVLNGFHIIDAKLAVLAMALVNNTHVTRLHLDGNSISDRGASLLAYAIQQNKTLTFLSLNDNHIGSAGVEAIAAALHHENGNTTLRTLRLANNRIGNHGGKRLRRMLRQNRTLTEIHLSGNRFGPKSVDKLRFDNRCKIAQIAPKVSTASDNSRASTTSGSDYTCCTSSEDESIKQDRNNAGNNGEGAGAEYDAVQDAFTSSMASLFGASLYMDNDDAMKYIIGQEDTRDEDFDASLKSICEESNREQKDFDTSWSNLASYMMTVQKTIDRSGGQRKDEDCNDDDLSVASSDMNQDDKDPAAILPEWKPKKTKWSRFKRTISAKKIQTQYPNSALIVHR